MYEPDIHQKPICIIVPPSTTIFHLRSDLISNLPIVRGRNDDDPHKHLKDFYWACDLLRPHGVSKEQLNLRTVHFSLVDSAKRWLFSLEPGTITTWNQLKKKFLEFCFSVTRAQSILKEIFSAKKYSNETLLEYWERYNKLSARLPYHQISNMDNSILLFRFATIRSKFNRCCSRRGLSW